MTPIIIGIGDCIISIKNSGRILIIGCFHFSGFNSFKKTNLYIYKIIHSIVK